MDIQVEFDRVVDADLYYSILSIFAVWCYIAFLCNIERERERARARALTLTHTQVWCYIAFHTRSFFLASIFMFQIVMSLPVGYFVYYNILQV
jgi:hypothetical protein